MVHGMTGKRGTSEAAMMHLMRAAHDRLCVHSHAVLSYKRTLKRNRTETLLYRVSFVNVTNGKFWYTHWGAGHITKTHQ